MLQVPPLSPVDCCLEVVEYLSLSLLLFLSHPPRCSLSPPLGASVAVMGRVRFGEEEWVKLMTRTAWFCVLDLHGSSRHIEKLKGGGGRGGGGGGGGGGGKRGRHNHERKGTHIHKRLTDI